MIEMGKILFYNIKFDNHNNLFLKKRFYFSKNYIQKTSFALSLYFSFNQFFIKLFLVVFRNDILKEWKIFKQEILFLHFMFASKVSFSNNSNHIQNRCLSNFFWINRTKRIASGVLLVAVALVLGIVLTLLPKTQESSSN